VRYAVPFSSDLKALHKPPGKGFGPEIHLALVEVHKPDDHRADSVGVEDTLVQVDMIDSLGDHKECSVGVDLLEVVDSHDFPLSPQSKEAGDVASALAQRNDLFSL
jgi:hypothetical protein